MSGWDEQYRAKGDAQVHRACRECRELPHCKCATSPRPWPNPALTVAFKTKRQIAAQTKEQANGHRQENV